MNKLSFKEVEVSTRTQQVDLQKNAVERDLRQLQERISPVEEQMRYLNEENQRLRQDNAEKIQAINELNVKLIHWDDREKELEAWKNRYNQLLENHNQELQHMRAHYDESFRIQLVFNSDLEVK